MKLKAVDLFAGAGGLSLGLEQAGIDVVLANEIEKDFAETYKANHPNTPVLTCDIADVNFKEELAENNLSGQIDIVCGGPPCQGFSTVGKKNFSDPRNSLFGQFLRAVDEIEPTVVLFENVSGFKKLYGGQIHSILLDNLNQRGYKTTSRVLDGADYGLPQNRQRTIVFGCLTNQEIKFPKQEYAEDGDLFGKKPYRTLMEAVSDLPEICCGGSKETYFTVPKNDYQGNLRGNVVTLTEHNCSNYGEKMQEILRRVPVGGSVLDLPESLRPKSYFNNTYARLLPDKPAPTITRNFGRKSVV